MEGEISDRLDGSVAWCKKRAAENLAKDVAAYEKGHNKALFKARYYSKGMTEEDWVAMLAAQGNRCAICGGEFGPRNIPHMDHNHRTDVIREVLCARCNMGLGHFRDDADLLQKAIVYLVKHGKVDLT